MPVLDTSTSPLATTEFTQRKVDRCQNGVAWAGYWNGTAGTSGALEFAYSVDDGATWTVDSGAALGFAGANATHTPALSLFIDIDDYAHLVYRDRDNGRHYYRRGSPNTARTAYSWSSSVELSTATAPTFADLVAHREGTGWTAHIVLSTAGGWRYARITITSGGVITNGGLTTPFSDISSPQGFPSIDFNHNGDGKTVAGGTPHLYVTYQRGVSSGLYFVKAAYSAGSWTWGTERQIDAARYYSAAGEWFVGMFDGTRVVIAGCLLDGTNFDVVLYDRDAADTTTTTRVLLDNTSTANRLLYGSAAYDGDGNVYLLGADRTGANGTRSLNYRKWTRATTTLGAIVAFDTTGPDAPHISAKRNHHGGRIDWVYTDGTASPYSVTASSIDLNQAPTAPVLVSPPNASVRDLAAGFAFDWTFTDPDTGDTQSAWAMRRKVSGAGAYEYWNVSTSAWQSTEVFNVGTTDGYTFSAGKWTTATVYNWSVATRDALGVTSPYASDFTVTSGQPPFVTVTAPLGSVTTTTRPVVSWSYSDPENDPQATYQVKVFTEAVASGGGFDPATTAATWDSTETTDAAARSRQVGVDLTNGTAYRAYVRSSQSGGQYSGWVHSSFSLSLTTPVAPTLAVAADLTNARVALTITGNDTGPTFTRANTYYVAEYSDDGTTWVTVRGQGEITPPPTGSITVYDYESTPGVARTYRAKTSANV